MKSLSNPDSEIVDSSTDKSTIEAPHPAHITPHFNAQETPPNLSRLTPDTILSLQQSVGNRAVTRLINNYKNTSTPIQRSLYNVASKWEDVTSTSSGNLDLNHEIYMLCESYFQITAYNDKLNHLNNLEQKVRARRKLSHDLKKIMVLNKILREIARERKALKEPLSVSEIAKYTREKQLYKHGIEKESKFPQELIDLRVAMILIVFQQDTVDSRSFKDVNDKNKDMLIRQAAVRGTSEGFWAGQLRCKESADFFGSSTEYKLNGIMKGDNHFIVNLGKGRWIDPTYRQFFMNEKDKWSTNPAIFEGDIKAFRDMGFDPEITEKYLQIIKKIPAPNLNN